MFGSEQIQHADAFLKAAPGLNHVEFWRDSEGEAVCSVETSDLKGSPVSSHIGKGDSLLDALKDALNKAGLNK